MEPMGRHIGGFKGYVIRFYCVLNGCVSYGAYRGSRTYGLSQGFRGLSFVTRIDQNL